jgi:hypothetical protein
MQWSPISVPDELPPDVSSRQRAAKNLIKQIRKLRWIGMEEEAERLQISLAGVPAEDRVLAEPQETD